MSVLVETPGIGEIIIPAADIPWKLSEKLISLIGYERAVQVARIAALTEKPVHTVVLRMKLLNEEQVAKLFTHVPVTNANINEE